MTKNNFPYRAWTICITLLIWHTASLAESSTASIKTPGADLANFPNSAFTLPQGHAYAELSPINYASHDSIDTPSQYSAGYLLRYGLLDDLELRLFSLGYTQLNDENKTKGLSPQVFDIKWHLLDESKDSLLPAIGLEVALQTDLASPNFKNGLQPALSLNFDQSLPYDIALEYNLGFITQQSNLGKTQYQLALSWALQRDVIEDLAVFIHGYTNTATGATSSAIGGGLQWTPARRISIFSNLNAGLTDSTPAISTLTGFAIAF
jgi:hypothetical protein